MKVFIMRHGEASQFCASDALRELTELGKEEAHLMGEWLATNAHSFDKIIVSPYKRAQQTANIVTKALNISDNDKQSLMITTEIITPLGDASVVHDYLDGLLVNSGIDKLLFVSHMPLVSYLVEELTVDGAMPIFQTAGVVEINYNIDAMKGHLLQQVAPHDLR